MSLSFFRSFPTLLFLACILCLGLRLPFHHITFFSVDEAVSAVAGAKIVEGGLPYRDAIDHRGPLTYYAYAGIFAIAGQNNMQAVHTVYLILILGLTIGIWWMATTLFSDKVGNWAALLFTVFAWANPFHEMWAAHTEWLLTAASLLGMLIWLKAGGKWYQLILAGICFGICTLSKQVGALELGAVLAFLACQWLLGQGKNIQSLLREGIYLLLGWSLPMIGSAWIFWAQGAWEDWLFYLWTYNTLYYMPEIDGGTRLLNTLKLFGAFFMHKWFLLGVLVWTVYQVRRGLRTDRKQLWLICWLGASTLEAMAGGRAFMHYLIPSLLPLCLLGAVGLSQLSDKWGKHMWARLLLVVGLLWPVAVNLVHHAFMLKDDTSISEFEAIVDHMRSQSKELDHIFVWGFAPEIYVLSDRRPASRFSFCNVLTGHIPAGNEAKSDTRYAIVPGTWETLMEELDHDPPAYIIDTQPGHYRAYGKYPMKDYPLGRLIESSYELDKAFHEAHPDVIFHVYQRRKS